MWRPIIFIIIIGFITGFIVQAIIDTASPPTPNPAFKYETEFARFCAGDQSNDPHGFCRRGDMEGFVKEYYE